MSKESFLTRELSVSSKTISFDLDGVLYDFHTPVMNRLKSSYLLSENAEIRYHDFGTEYPELSAIVSQIALEPETYEVTPIIREGLNLALKLLGNGYKLHFLTARHDDCFSVTERRLKEDLGVDKVSLRTFGNKIEKVSHLLECMHDYVIEDNPSVHYLLKDGYTREQLIIVRQYWNRKSIHGYHGLLLDYEEIERYLNV